MKTTKHDNMLLNTYSEKLLKIIIIVKSTFAAAAVIVL